MKTTTKKWKFDQGLILLGLHQVSVVKTTNTEKKVGKN
jgi:hypothetical protein